MTQYTLKEQTLELAWIMSGTNTGGTWMTQALGNCAKASTIWSAKEMGLIEARFLDEFEGPDIFHELNDMTDLYLDMWLQFGAPKHTKAVRWRRQLADNDLYNWTQTVHACKNLHSLKNDFSTLVIKGSPQDIWSVDSLVKQLPMVRLMFMVRHPLGMADSTIRSREVSQIPVNIDDVAYHVVNEINTIVNAYRRHFDGSLFIKYEDIPNEVETIRNWLPDFEDFSLDNDLVVKQWNPAGSHNGVWENKNMKAFENLGVKRIDELIRSIVKYDKYLGVVKELYPDIYQYDAHGVWY